MQDKYGSNMELQTKPDFGKTLQRFEAWWHCQIVDRPVVTIRQRQRNGQAVPRKTHATLRDRWMDMDYAVETFAASIRDAIFPADSFPLFFPNVGPEICSTVFGCDLEFAEVTSYSKPIAGSCRDILSLKPDLDNPYWNAIRHGTQLSLQAGAGKWITGLADLHTNGDLLASLRDPQNLCLDLADDIDGVRAACDHVTKHYPLMFDDLWKPIQAAGQPCTTWTPVLHAGRSYVTNCDFICMISPEMFQRTILPALVEEMRFLERNIFHLDGPGALKHLEALLKVKELNGVQWIYGASRGPAAKWIDVYKRIQAAGKCAQICCQDIPDALAVMENIRPKGAWFDVRGAHEAQEIEAFLDRVTRWAAGRKA